MRFFLTSSYQSFLLPVKSRRFGSHRLNHYYPESIKFDFIVQQFSGMVKKGKIRDGVAEVAYSFAGLMMCEMPEVESLNIDQGV